MQDIDTVHVVSRKRRAHNEPVTVPPPQDVECDPLKSAMCIPAEIWHVYVMPRLDPETLAAAHHTCELFRTVVERDYVTFRMRRPWQLFPYQMNAVCWMQGREALPPASVHGLRGGIVALSMGLGKTLVTMAHALIDKHMHPGAAPTLVIVSKQILWEWANDHAKFYGQSRLRVFFMHSSMMKRPVEDVDWDSLKGCDIVVTTYDVVAHASRTHNIADQRVLIRNNAGAVQTIEECQPNTFTDYTIKGPRLLFHVTWQRIVTDESHLFSNRRSSLFHALMSLQARFKWCLTGTAIRNTAQDLWSLLRFCGAQRAALGALKRFNMELVYQLGLVDGIHFRSYEDVGVKLPEKREHREIIKWDETDEMRKRYEQFHAAAKRELVAFEQNEAGVTYANVLELFTKMRALCNAPVLAGIVHASDDEEVLAGPEEQRSGNGSEQEEHEGIVFLSRKSETETNATANTNATGTEKDVQAHDPDGIDSPKMRTIARIVEKHVVGSGTNRRARSGSKNAKLTIFSSWTASLDLVYQVLVHRAGMKPAAICRLDGRMGNGARQQSIARFRRSPQARIMIMSYGVGSYGLNLSEATTSICVDPWWTPVVLLQAEARIHRTGQRQPVDCYRLEMENSIETRMVEQFCRAKALLNDDLMGKSRPSRLDAETMRKMLFDGKYKHAD